MSSSPWSRGRCCYYPHYPGGETEARADSAMCPRSPILKEAAPELEPSSSSLCRSPVPLRETVPRFPGREAEAQRARTDSRSQGCLQAERRFGSRAHRLALHAAHPPPQVPWVGRSGRASTGGMGPSRWHKVTLPLPRSLRLDDQMTRLWMLSRSENVTVRRESEPGFSLGVSRKSRSSPGPSLPSP